MAILLLDEEMMIKKWQSRFSSGSTLVEIIVATAVVALVLVTIVSAITVSIRNTATAKEKEVATKYGQEGMEFFIREKNSLGWESFLAAIQKNGSNVTYCLQTIPTNDAAFLSLAPGACGGTQYVDPRNIFKRSAVATIGTVNGATQINITVTVNWSDSSINHQSQLLQVFRQSYN